LRAVQRIQPTHDGNENHFFLQVANQAGKLFPSHARRESAVDEFLVNSLQFLGSKTVLGIEVIKQDQLAFNIRGLYVFGHLWTFPILQAC